ncbi:beta-xylosidase [Longimycelium tulufanense]|uniref:Beta-xylosidase n=1 Tax=Longimycelium tulufanense TaxID=907463 RepID=A0A8J3CHZ3_9PSEU|nr:beta-xylosidase [Longimycelium tulufanense]GGM70296.1 beta-xylosidase [Longimycelium tulufanense]
MGRKPRRVVCAVATLVAAAVLAACGTSSQGVEPTERPSSIGAPSPQNRADAPNTPPRTLQTGAERNSSGVVVSGGGSAPYNYGPTVIREDGRYRVWWCSQLPGAGPAGDDVLYAESTNAEGPFAAPGGAQAAPVFSGSGGSFDAMHTCDPSVIKINGTYYLYYTGAASDDHAHGNAIGVASSPDGIRWSRMADGQPIVRPAGDEMRENAYGAGQPAALYLDGWFYLLFTDTSGRAAGWNGAGQFVLRAKEPTFRTDVQALEDGGFAPVRSTRSPRTRSVVDAFSADWMWVDALEAFAIAHQTEHGTTITFWDRDFNRNPYQPLLVKGTWKEGPGLVRRADGHAPISVGDPCARVPIDVYRATRLTQVPQDVPTDIARFGLDVEGVDGCGTRDRALAVLDGFAVPSPERTIDLLTGGKALRVERRSVAEAMAVRVLDKRPAALDNVDIPVAGWVKPGVPAVRAAERPLGFLLADGRLWPIGSEEVAKLNSSRISDVTTSRWDSYPPGPNLTALR